MAERKSKTYFEQVPVELVKKIAQQRTEKKKEAEKVIVEGPTGKTEPCTLRPHSAWKKGL